MQATVILSALLLAVASTAPLSAYAETDPGKPRATETSAAKPATKKMKPHSHAEEKMGMALGGKSEAKPEGTDDQTTMKKRDKTKHHHPTDGK